MKRVFLSVFVALLQSYNGVFAAPEIPRSNIRAYISFDEAIPLVEGGKDYLQLEYPSANGLDVDGPDIEGDLVALLPSNVTSWKNELSLVSPNLCFELPAIEDSYSPAAGTVCFWYKPGYSFPDDPDQFDGNYFGGYKLFELEGASSLSIENNKDGYDYYRNNHPTDAYSWYLIRWANDGCRHGIHRNNDWLKWHFIAVTWENGAIQKLRVDNVTQDLPQATCSASSDQDGKLLFGGAPGNYDEFVLFDISLSDEQLELLYESRTNGKTIKDLLTTGLQMRRANYTRGESPIELKAWPSDAVFELVKLPRNVLAKRWPNNDSEKSLDANQFSPGSYLLTSSYAGRSDTMLISISEPFPPSEMPFGGYPVFGSNPGRERMSKNYLFLLSQMGVDHIYVQPSLAIRKWLDYGFGVHVRMIPNLNLGEFYSHFANLTPNDYGQRLLERTTTSAADYSLLRVVQTPCPRNPDNLDRIVDYVSPLIQRIKDYPGVFALGLDDEYGLAFNDADYSRGCYDRNCIEYFENATGLSLSGNLPDLIESQPTLLDPTNNVKHARIVKWCELNGIAGGNFTAGLRSGRPAMAYYGGFVREKIHEITPNLDVFRLLGGEYGDMDAQMVRIYPTNFDSKGGGTWGEPELFAALNIDLNRAMQINERPLWTIIGWYDDPPALTEGLAEHLQLAAYTSIARGCQTLQIGPAMAFEESRYSSALHDLGRLVKDYGAWFKSLKPARAPVAFWYSELNEQLLQNDLDGHNLMEQSARLWYPALMLAGVPVEIVTDKSVLEGELINRNYELVFAPGMRHTTIDLQQKVNEFVEQGGKVVTERGFYDFGLSGNSEWHEIGPSNLVDHPINGPSWRLERRSGFLKGHNEKEASVHMRIPEIQATILPLVEKRIKVVVNNTFVASSISQCEGGIGQVLFLLNSDLWMDHCAKVSFKNQFAPTYVYDAIQHSKIEGGRDGSFSILIPKGGWRVLLLTDQCYCRIESGVEILGLDSLGLGAGLQVSGTLLDSSGTAVTACVPVQITIDDSSCRRIAYSGTWLMANGKFSQYVRIESDFFGSELRLKCKNMITGISNEIQFPFLVEKGMPGKR